MSLPPNGEGVSKCYNNGAFHHFQNLVQQLKLLVTVFPPYPAHDVFAISSNSEV